MGGFHLSGENESLIDPTKNEMKKIDPNYVVPMHCTGWNAINRCSILHRKRGLKWIDSFKKPDGSFRQSRLLRFVDTAILFDANRNRRMYL